MTDKEILEILKVDLGISVSVEAYDKMLMAKISQAKAAIKERGINIMDNDEDGMLIEEYAAEICRKRKKDNFDLSRSLKLLLNDRKLGKTNRQEEE